MPGGLEQARTGRGLTQTQLALLSGVSQSAIATIEGTPDPNPRWDTVARLSRALRMSPFELFGRTRSGRRRLRVRP